MGFVVALAVGLAGEAGEGVEGESYDIVFEAAGAVRTEHFILEAPVQEGEEGASTRHLVPVGTVQWRKSEGDGESLFECDVRFPEVDLHVRHCERAGPVVDGAAQLVWRELCPAKGRSIALFASEGGSAYLLKEWGGRQIRRVRFEREGKALPLVTLEAMRTGVVVEASFEWFDPLRGLFETVTSSVIEALVEEPVGPADLELRLELDPGPGGQSTTAAKYPAPVPLVLERTVELLRRDGSLAARFRFRDGSLEEFQWQRGGLVARRVDASEYQRFVRSFGPPAAAR